MDFASNYEDVERHDTLLLEAYDLVKAYIGEAPLPEGISDEEIKADLLAAVRKLDAVVRINPQNWSAYYLTGRIDRIIGLNAVAYSAFREAYRIICSQIDDESVSAVSDETTGIVLNELSYEALFLDMYKEALYYTTAAKEFMLADPAIEANRCVAMTMLGQVDEAVDRLKKNLAESEYEDAIRTKVEGILKVLTAIKSGDYDYPKTFKEYCAIVDKVLPTEKAKDDQCMGK